MNTFRAIYIFFCFFIALLITSCNEPATSPYPDIVFEKDSVMTNIGRASGVSFVIDGKAYVTLGRTASASDSLKECWQFTPETHTWIQKAPFPGNARVKAVAVVLNGKAYVGLGFRPHRGGYSGGYLNDLWMYDPITDTWTQKANFKSTAVDACVSFVANNTIYVGAGFTGFDFTSEFWKYDPINDSWLRVNDFRGNNRAGGAACASAKHIFYGTGCTVINYNDWWEYFPATDSWNQRKSMPDKGRTTAIAISVNDRYFVATGRHFGGNMTGGHLKSDIMEFDADKNVWYDRGNLPTEGRENAISFTINGVGYIGFGESDNRIFNDLWSFKP